MQKMVAMVLAMLFAAKIGFSALAFPTRPSASRKKELS